MNITQATEIAINASNHSNMKFHVGVVIFNNHRHVFGYNRKFDCTVYKHKEIFSIHAEEMAIIRAYRSNINLKNAEMLIVRVNRNGDLMPIIPCRDCKRLIKNAGIKKIHYVAEK